MENTTQTQVDPSKIMQVGMGFMASKTLLTAVNMELLPSLQKENYLEKIYKADLDSKIVISMTF